MATTMTAPVNNNISLAQRYLPMLDEIYKEGSKSAILDTMEERVRWDGAKTVFLFTVTPNGMGQYSRNAGFVPGEVDGEWTPYEITVDRARSYTVDVMDNDETLGLTYGALLAETERTQVVPEVDAYRFAKYAVNSGLHSAATNLTTPGVKVVDLIQEAERELDDAEVPVEGRILFVSPAAYKQLKGEITRFTENGDPDINGNVEVYDDMRVIRVPSGRFNTAIQLNAPTQSTDIGGFTLLGATINFMIIHPSAILQVVKHKVPRIFSPEQNQEADAWKLNYRIYHDCWVKKNKKKGIYLCSSVPTNAMAAGSSSAAISGTGSSTVTITNAQGTVTAVSSNTAVCTCEINSSGNVVITGVTTGTATVTVEDAIGQSVTISVTVS